VPPTSTAHRRRRSCFPFAPRHKDEMQGSSERHSAIRSGSDEAEPLSDGSDFLVRRAGRVATFAGRDIFRSLTRCAQAGIAHQQQSSSRFSKTAQTGGGRRGRRGRPVAGARPSPAVWGAGEGGVGHWGGSDGSDGGAPGRERARDGRQGTAGGPCAPAQSLTRPSWRTLPAQPCRFRLHAAASATFLEPARGALDIVAVGACHLLGLQLAATVNDLELDLLTLHQGTEARRVDG